MKIEEHTGDDYLSVWRNFTKTVEELPDRIFFQRVDKNPETDRMEIVDQFTYEEAKAKADQIAYFLKESVEVSPGDKVLISGDPNTTWIGSYLAVLKIGAVVSPSDPDLKKELESNLKLLKPDFALIDENDLSGNQKKLIEEYSGNVFSFQTLDKLKNPESRVKLEETEKDIHQESHVLFTSGTSGNPEAKALNDANFASNVRGSLKFVPVDEQDVFILISGLHHVFPLMATFLISLHTGAKFIFTKPKNVKQVARMTKPTLFFGVPRLYRLIYDRTMKKLAKELSKERSIRILQKLNILDEDFLEIEKLEKFLLEPSFIGLENLLGSDYEEEITVHLKNEKVNLNVKDLLASHPDIDQKMEILKSLVRPGPIDTDVVDTELVKERMNMSSWDNLKERLSPSKVIKRFLHGKVIQELGEKLLRQFGGKIRFFFSGSAPSTTKTLCFFRALKILHVEGYGMTECSPVLSAPRLRKPEDRYMVQPLTSVGKVLDNISYEIRNKDSQGIGELVVRGPSVFLGRLKEDGSLNKDKFDEDGFFHTGDLVWEDESGNVFIMGRKKRMIILSIGKNVYPEQVEKELAAIRAITGIVVRGIEEDGETIGIEAVVYPNWDVVGSEFQINVNSDKGISTKLKKLAKDLIEAKIEDATSNSSYYLRPRRVEIIERDFERTSNGDIKYYLYQN